MIFQVVAVHLVRNLYYSRGKASKIQHSSVFHTPGQSLMHLRSRWGSHNRLKHCVQHNPFKDTPEESHGNGDWLLIGMSFQSDSTAY